MEMWTSHPANGVYRSAVAAPSSAARATVAGRQIVAPAWSVEPEGKGTGSASTSLPLDEVRNAELKAQAICQ